MKTDIEISQSNKMKPITSIARTINIPKKDLMLFGDYKAKVLKKGTKTNSDLILVTSINPTKEGEGKSTCTVGLLDSLNYLGVNAAGALREPSLGPVFGRKGGATGGGYAQVVPMEDINLHFTGDMHAITTCNNLICACIDNTIYYGNELDIKEVLFTRVLDLNDRSLRKVVVNGGFKKVPVREDSFKITVASEIMAVLCLAEDFTDLERRLNNIVIAINSKDEFITLKELNITGSLLLILKDAINPNLVQTLYKSPVFIHGGPFANIAHGNNSILATKMALSYSDYVVTEAGFGADLGFEKFLNIKCRTSNLVPSCVVIVATIKALKMHSMSTNGGIYALKEGICNLEKHIENVENSLVNYVVALNKFESDTKEEIEYITNYFSGKGIDISICESYSKGKKGNVDLAKKVIEKCKTSKKELKFTYDLDDSINEKIEKVCTNMYGAKSVVYSEKAKEKINKLSKDYSKLMICIAKTPHSLTDDPSVIGRPTNFDIHVTDVYLSSGAEFIVVLTGDVMTMPGLPKVPNAVNISIDKDGIIKGLS